MNNKAVGLVIVGAGALYLLTRRSGGGLLPSFGASTSPASTYGGTSRTGTNGTGVTNPFGIIADTLKAATSLFGSKSAGPGNIGIGGGAPSLPGGNGSYGNYTNPTYDTSGGFNLADAPGLGATGDGIVDGISADDLGLVDGGSIDDIVSDDPTYGYADYDALSDFYNVPGVGDAYDPSADMSGSVGDYASDGSGFDESALADYYDAGASYDDGGYL